MIGIRMQVVTLFLFVSLGMSAAVAQSAPGATNAVVPTLASFSGILTDLDGKPITGVAGVTFSLYKDSEGGVPLWMEVQNVRPDETGHYTVALGATKNEGLPTGLFASGEARWLGVQAEGQAEQPRVLLLSVPYALKAGDASTVGGLPASAFMLANSGAAAGKSSNPSTTAPPSATGKAVTPANPAVTGKGTLDYIPMWDSASDIINSVIFQKTSKVGISTTSPAQLLDVNGKTDIRDTLTLFPNSTDNTLGVSGTSFKVSSTGLVTFISGQTFPGAGTITGVTTATGSGLSGGGTTGSLSLKVPSAGITNAMLQNSKVTLNASTAGGLTVPGAMTLGSTYTIGLKTCSTNQVLQYSGTAWNCATIGGTGTITGVTAGTDLTGGGTTGTVTLNLDTTKVPQLAAANTFTGTDKFNGNVGIGAAPFTNTYTPLALGGSTTFGTWLSLANTSAGGHTWNFLSAGSANGEGAGNLGITDLTGTSTIWLEGNVNVSSNLAVTGTSSGSTLNADALGANAGGPTPGLLFGAGGSGEGIASNRTIGYTKYGLDFYTNYTSRMSVFNSGQVSIGTQIPSAQLAVLSSSNSHAAIYAQSADAVGGSGQDGADGEDVYGSSGDTTSGSTSFGGSGVIAYGGGGGGGTGGTGGAGAVFQGGNGMYGGFGIVGISGNTTGGGFDQEAGYFVGDVYATGQINSGEAAVKIDHPLDPASKYLSHSAVVSSDMKTMYDGTVTTDASGQAIVELPDWFEALNRDFRYQLTVIGQFAQAIVATKVANHQFAIRTDKPNVEVSWQVTGIRQDAWANTHRTPVELDKPDGEKGFYLHPELYGAAPEQGIIWARNPEMMKRRRATKLAPPVLKPQKLAR